MVLRIATRRSALAIWQAEHVAERLRAAHPGLEVEVLAMSTRGDEILDTPLALVGGKGLFTHELERAMLEGRADLAVHSLKDMPATLPEGMTLGAVLERGDPHDAFVSNRYESLESLPDGSRVGTSSLRRQSQLKHYRSHLIFEPLRGNVNTRLARLDAGELDAIILAAAGLMRLGYDRRVAQLIPAETCLPAIGQGVLGVECLSDANEVIELLQVLEHRETRVCIEAERSVNRCLGGDCHAPIAAFAQLDGHNLHIRARVASPDGSIMLVVNEVGPADDPVAAGEQVAGMLLAQGAADLLAAWVPT